MRIQSRPILFNSVFIAGFGLWLFPWFLLLSLLWRKRRICKFLQSQWILSHQHFLLSKGMEQWFRSLLLGMNLPWRKMIDKSLTSGHLWIESSIKVIGIVLRFFILLPLMRFFKLKKMSIPGNRDMPNEHFIESTPKYYNQPSVYS